MAYELDQTFPFLAPQGRLHMVSFGAPRVGNAAFCEDYDSRLRDVSFRVVNGLDVVARCVRARGAEMLKVPGDMVVCVGGGARTCA
jgi:predicted lipase